MYDQMKNTGLTINASFVGNDVDGYTAGAHITSSEGMDVSAEVSDSSPDKVINDLTVKLMRSIMLDSKKQLADKKREESKNKLDDLYQQVSELEDEINRIEYELYGTDEEVEEKDPHPTLDDIFGFEKDDFLSYLDSLVNKK